MKKGFGLITAIIFIVLIATVATMSLSLSSQTAKQTGDIFVREQAELLIYGAAEYAILSMQYTDYDATCLTKIDATYPDATNPLFNITTKIYYFNNPKACGEGDKISKDELPEKLAHMGFIDITVETNSKFVPEKIRLHKSLLQNP